MSEIHSPADTDAAGAETDRHRRALLIAGTLPGVLLLSAAAILVAGRFTSHPLATSIRPPGDGFQLPLPDPTPSPVTATPTLRQVTPTTITPTPQQPTPSPASPSPSAASPVPSRVPTTSESSPTPSPQETWTVEPERSPRSVRQVPATPAPPKPTGLRVTSVPITVVVDPPVKPRKPPNQDDDDHGKPE